VRPAVRKQWTGHRRALLQVVESVPLLTLVSQTPGRWTRYQVEGKERRIDLYVAHDDQPKPIIVLLHGSSCAPDFTVDSDKSLHETSIFQDAIGPSLKRAAGHSEGTQVVTGVLQELKNPEISGAGLLQAQDRFGTFAAS
jgi:hypothetical protein